MSIPLANKYRPLKLSDVIGQDVTSTILLNSFNAKRWHHAYIMSGNPGSGKTSCARIMAAMENCEKAPTAEPCGKCKNCLDIFYGKSNDVKEIDAASNRGIEDIRELQRDAGYAPMSCKIKYYIIDECHGLTGYAADAILKFLEEPPNNTRIILATTEPQSLKQTILSRCILLNFPKVDRNRLNEQLKKICSKEKISFEEVAINQISKLSEGSVRNSLQLLQSSAELAGNKTLSVEHVVSVAGDSSSEAYFQLFEDIFGVEPAKAFGTLDKILSSGVLVSHIIDGILEHVRAIKLAKVCKDKMMSFGYTEEEYTKYLFQSQKVDFSTLKKISDEMVNVKNAIAVNLDAQNYLENLIILAIIELSKVKNKKSQENAQKTEKVN
jgi:DNA polymerase-3 subunit gamma/tau